MAKTLKEPAPSSSVARLFSTEAAARATAPSLGEAPIAETRDSAERLHIARREAKEDYSKVTTSASGESANIKREFVLSLSTDETFTEILHLFQRITGTRLNASYLARALIKGMAHSMETIQREARLVGKQKLPSNARGREGERERFEDRLAEALVNGIRAAPGYSPK